MRRGRRAENHHTRAESIVLGLGASHVRWPGNLVRVVDLHERNRASSAPLASFRRRGGRAPGTVIGSWAIRLRWLGLRWLGLRWLELRWLELRWLGLRWLGLRWLELWFRWRLEALV